MAHGKVERGWLGVSVQDLTYEQASSLGLSTSKGAVVMEVVKESPAEKAGILAGDVITNYQGTPIADASELRNYVATTKIGQAVEITVWRKGKSVNLNARIGNLETAVKVLATSLKARLGAEFRPVTASESEKYGLESQMGVAVSSLSEKSPLKEAGIELNDIILGVNGQTIENMDSFLSTMATVTPNQQITVLVLDHRSGNTGTVQVQLP